jgi:hypothetical protein
MVRDECGAKGELVPDIAHAMLAMAEKCDDASTAGLGNRLESRRHVGCQGGRGWVRQRRVHAKSPAAPRPTQATC